ncbi:MAG: CBS domain-containing protein [Nitrososphaerales archaeon]|jgi:CBS domain-containing protein
MPTSVEFGPNGSIHAIGGEPVEKVRDVMTRRVIYAIAPDTTVVEAAKKMRETQTGCLVVVEGPRAVGIITERDLVHRVLAEGLPPAGLKVSRVMTKDPVTIGPEASVSDAALLMAEHKIRRLVVTEADDVVGILTTTDFAKLLLRKSDTDLVSAAMTRESPPPGAPHARARRAGKPSMSHA